MSALFLCCAVLFFTAITAVPKQNFEYSSITQLNGTIIDLSAHGIAATITLPDGITAEVDKFEGSVRIKLSDGSVLMAANAFDKRDIKILMTEYKDLCKTSFDKIDYLIDEPNVVVYKGEMMGVNIYGITGYKKIKENNYCFNQLAEPGLKFTEEQCKTMLAVFKTVKAK